MLETSIADIWLKHPVMNASGILGSEPEHLKILAKYGFSILVTKTFTLEPRPGNPPPIIIELDNGGFINAVGLANPGALSIPLLVEAAREIGVPLIVSIGGRNVAEYVSIVEIINETKASAIELNLSCPHTKGLGLEIGSDPKLVYEISRDTVSISRIPIIAKLGLCDKVIESAGKALEAGVEALTLINTIKAMAIDVYSMKPILSNKYGGLSGPPIRPIAIRVVYDVYREYGAEIIGCGGVRNWRDVAEFLLAGARAVQVGSYVVKNENIVWEILSGLEKWLSTIGYGKLLDVVGLAHKT